MNLNPKLDDKVAIVTGGGKGVGAAIALALGRAGARVAVNDINPDRAEKTAGQIKAAGGEAIAIGADVANKFQCVHLVESTRAEWGQLDILVNHASVDPRSTILKLDEWDWQRCLDVNLKGTFFMCQLTGRVMADENRSRGGRMINITGPAGFLVPAAHRAAACASQAGIIGFTRECAREYASFGITVNAVVPIQADVSVPVQAPTLTDPTLHSLREAIGGDSSRPSSLIEHTATVVVTLCSRAGSRISGQIVPVDENGMMG